MNKSTLALLCALISAACATPKPVAPIQLPPQIVVQTRFQFPPAPREFLICDPEPLAPDAQTDSELAQWAENLRLAGSDCRAKIDSLRVWVDGWPK